MNSISNSSILTNGESTNEKFGQTGGHKGGQVATMLELHTSQVDTTTIKRARKNEKEQLRGDKAEVPPWDGQQ